jgi:hypothetical protein
MEAALFRFFRAQPAQRAQRAQPNNINEKTNVALIFMQKKYVALCDPQIAIAACPAVAARSAIFAGSAIRLHINGLLSSPFSAGTGAASISDKV